jgi:hypothetical protein
MFSCPPSINKNKDLENLNLNILEVPMSRTSYKSEKSTKHIIELSFYSNQVSQEERQISLAFSIIAHDQFSLLETLIASLFRPHNSYCIFVDAKATTDFHNMVKQLVDCYKYQYPQARSKFNF